MAIFGFKKQGGEKLEQGAQAAKGATATKSSGTKITKKAMPVKTTKVSATKVVAPSLSSGIASSAASVVIRPRITEKSGVLSQGNVYTFEVAKNANKITVSKAISALYKVVPLKISIINTPIRNVFVKGRYGAVGGIKKAIVTIKKGDKIDFV